MILLDKAIYLFYLSFQTVTVAWLLLAALSARDFTSVIQEYMQFNDDDTESDSLTGQTRAGRPAAGLEGEGIFPFR